MAAPLSLDLRERVVTAVAASASHCQAAERFGASLASAICWQNCFRARRPGRSQAALRLHGARSRFPCGLTQSSNFCQRV